MGLNALIDELRADSFYAILDLGPALGVNVDFWSRFPCRLYIGDFYRGLQAELSRRSDEDEWSESVIERLFSFSPDTRFDLILCWDIFNHLTQEQLTSLIAWLARLSKPGALLFALMWLESRISMEPLAFRIVDREHMDYAGRSAATKAGPRYQPRELGKIMRGFDVSNSFLLRHGVQEYLFVYRGE